MQVICSNSAIALAQGRGRKHCQPHDSDPEAGCEGVGVCIACGRPGGSCMPVKPDCSHLTDEDLNEALSSCRRAIDSEHEIDAVYAHRDAIIAEMERRVRDTGSCATCEALGYPCDFDAVQGRCSVLS